MLKGRCAREARIDAAAARKLVAVLGELGLEAVVEEVAVRAALAGSKAPSVSRNGAARTQSP